MIPDAKVDGQFMDGASGRRPHVGGQTSPTTGSGTGGASRPSSFAADEHADWFACDCHGDPHMIFARCGGRLLCAKGWRAAGFPRADQATPQTIHETETAVRERMTARGGKDRYMVRAGKS